MVLIKTIYGYFNAPNIPTVCQTPLILNAVEEAREIFKLPTEIPVYEQHVGDFS